MGYKYRLDRENLVFVKEKITLKSYIIAHKQKLILGSVIGILIWSVAFFNLIESPKKYILEKRENNLIRKLGNINSSFDSINNELALIQHRDDNFYRIVSKLDPIPSTVRKQGFGGVNSYASLQGFDNSEFIIESNRKSDIIKKQMNLQSESFDTIISSVLELHDSLLTVPAISPVSPYDYHRISSEFGYRIHPLSGKRQKHDGLDFAARVGKPVYSTGKGIVTLVKKSNIGYGNRIVIKHGFNYKTVYAHLDEMNVCVGDTVVRGQKIGTVGNTGTSTGPHLHYEVIYKRRKNDPGKYYLNDLSKSEYDAMLDSFDNLN